jgi:lipopolysaccharide/colanic/teichoic acid biosynthesis glycosyltransferase
MADSERLNKRQAPFSLRLRLVVKRGIDIVLSLVLLVLLSPILLVSAVAILVSQGRPILFRQTRVGRNAQEFSMIKFRSMATDAEQMLDEIKASNERTGPLFKVNNDPRVTTIGRILRRSSIDELPQLLNVLAGSMSLVGPRPALPAEVAEFSDQLRRRELVAQGLTGLWQVNGRTDPDFTKYAELDLRYVDTWTLRLDLWIIIRTPFVILGQMIHRNAVATPAPTTSAPVPSSNSAVAQLVTPNPATAAPHTSERRVAEILRGDSALELAE